MGSENRRKIKLWFQTLTLNSNPNTLNPNPEP